MPRPRVLIAEETDGLFYLIRFAEDGEFAGDTLHFSVEELKEAAEWEYDRRLEWRQVPPEVTDVVVYALGHVSPP